MLESRSPHSLAYLFFYSCHVYQRNKSIHVNFVSEALKSHGKCKFGKSVKFKKIFTDLHFHSTPFHFITLLGKLQAFNDMKHDGDEPKT